MSNTISPNMGLVVPNIGNEPGPTWASDLNASLSILDQHNHTSGQGTQIPAAGLNINADLPINSNNLTLVRSVRFSPQTIALSGASDLGCIYLAGVDLYCNDGAGNQIRITQSGAVAGSSGTITGLPSGTASASYAGGTFTFQSATSTAANLDVASIVLRNSTASSKGLTLSPPNAMASNYSLVLPTIPATTSIMTLDTSGNISAPYTVDNSSIVISSNVIKVGTAGITTSLLASGSVTASKLDSSAVTNAKSQIITSSTTWTVPSNCFWVDVDGWGGGGGGGAGSTVAGGGAGGAGGSAGNRYIGKWPVTPGATVSITIGAGGAGGALTGASGSSGSATVFGTLSIAGGAGGAGAASTTPGSGSTNGYTAFPQYQIGGGSGGGIGTPGSAGNRSLLANPGSGGSSSTSGGGGGGAAGHIASGTGGNGGNAPNGNASSASLANSGAGGGGGSGSEINLGGSGGNGASGQLTIYWIALP